MIIRCFSLEELRDAKRDEIVQFFGQEDAEIILQEVRHDEDIMPMAIEIERLDHIINLAAIGHPASILAELAKQNKLVGGMAWINLQVLEKKEEPHARD